MRDKIARINQCMRDDPEGWKCSFYYEPPYHILRLKHWSHPDITVAAKKDINYGITSYSVSLEITNGYKINTLSLVDDEGIIISQHIDNILSVIEENKDRQIKQEQEYLYNNLPERWPCQGGMKKS